MRLPRIRPRFPFNRVPTLRMVCARAAARPTVGILITARASFVRYTMTWLWHTSMARSVFFEASSSSPIRLLLFTMSCSLLLMMVLVMIMMIMRVEDIINLRRQIIVPLCSGTLA